MFRSFPLVLAAVLACQAAPPEEDAPEVLFVDSAALEVASCGDGELDDGEDCDAGDANGADANCLESCLHNPEQALVVGVDAFDLQPADAVGVDDDTAPAGFGAWAAGQVDTSGDGLLKFELTIDPFWPSLSPSLVDLTVTEIAEISFHTRKTSFQDGDDYYLVLYTEPDGLDDAETWYGYRLTALPHLARALDAPSDTWNRWSTAVGPNQLVFGDEPTTGSFSGAGLPTLPELQENRSFDWSAVLDGVAPTAIDYGAERVKWIAIHSLSGDAVVGFDGRVDQVRIDRTDGRSLVLDLEPAAP